MAQAEAVQGWGRKRRSGNSLEKQQERNERRARPFPAHRDEPSSLAQRGEGKGERHGHGSSVQDPATLCVPAPQLEELLVPHSIQIKGQSTGRDLDHPEAALGSHQPRELQPGAHAGTNASVGKGPSPCAASWGDKGTL